MSLFDSFLSYLRKVDTRSTLKGILVWQVPLVLITSALLLAETEIRLSLLLTYVSLMLFLMITKDRLDKAISDQSAIEQLRRELTAHREATSVIAYLNSVVEPTIPIWYSRAYRGYSSSVEMQEELLNRIVATGPKTILELGSGLSTLIASYAVKKNGFGRVTSWDSLETRALGNREIIKAHKLERFSDIHYVEIVEKPEGLDNFSWYAREPETGIDFLIIDDSLEQAGIPDAKNALKMLKDYLATGCTIILHDAIRTTEKETLNYWLENNDELLLVHTVRTATNTYSVLRFGLR
jgi:predicted O-methyltransferase YrrM